MKFIATIFLALFLFSCASVEETIDSPNIVAIPTSAEYSGWDIDHCADARDEGVECFQQGGQIYIVNIKNVRGSNLRQLLVAQHALLVLNGNNESWCFNIEPASAKLVEATGVTHIAREYRRGC